MVVAVIAQAEVAAGPVAAEAAIAQAEEEADPVAAEAAIAQAEEEAADPVGSGAAGHAITAVERYAASALTISNILITRIPTAFAGI